MSQQFLSDLHAMASNFSDLECPPNAGTFEAPTRDLREKNPVLDEDPPTTKNRVGRIKDDLDAFFLSKNREKYEDFQCPKCSHTQNRANAGGSQLSRSRSQELFQRADLKDCSKLFVEDAWVVEEDSVQLSQKVSSTDDDIFGAFDVLLYGILVQVGVNSQQALQCHEVRVLIENFRGLCIERTMGSADMEKSAQVKIADQMITGFIEWMSSIGQILRNVEEGNSLDQEGSKLKDINDHLTLALVAQIEKVRFLESSSGTKNDFKEVEAIFQHLCSLMATMQGLMINQPRRSFNTSSGVLKVETSKELSIHFQALKDGITQLQFEMKDLLAEAVSELDELIFDISNLQDNPAKASNKVSMAHRKVSSVISCVANGVQLRLRQIVQEKFDNLFAQPR